MSDEAVKLLREWHKLSPFTATPHHIRDRVDALLARIDSAPVKPDEPEPGQLIGKSTCASCGADLEILHGDEPGKIGVLSHGTDVDDVDEFGPVDLTGLAPDKLPKGLEPESIQYLRGQVARLKAELARHKGGTE